MEKITLILDDIERLCNHVTRGHELKDDLKQEVVLTMLEVYGDCDRYELEELRKIAARIVYTMWYSEALMQGKYTNTKSFFYKYKLIGELSTVNFEDIRFWVEDDEDGQHAIDKQAKEKIDELVEEAGLSSLDKDILKEYLNRSCKVSQFSKDADVSRHQLNKRIEYIKNELKKANEKD